jgi:hypothetical protein
MNATFRLPNAELRQAFVAALQAASDLPRALRDNAQSVAGLEIGQFDRSYLEFLDAQISLSPRGPEWTQRLIHRRAGLRQFCDVPLIDGRVYIASTNTEYWVKVDPATGSVAYWEEYLEARSATGRS